MGSPEIASSRREHRYLRVQVLMEEVRREYDGKDEELTLRIEIQEDEEDEEEEEEVRILGK